MVKILNTRFYDDYFQSLLELEADFPSCEFIYEPIGVTWINQLDFENDLIKVVVCTDFLTNADLHDRFRDLHQLMANFPEGRVIVASPVYNAHLDYDLPNIKFICNGADFMYQLEQYNQLEHKEKNFNRQRHWSYMSFIPRTHRLTVGCWLAGNNYPGGFVKVNFGQHTNPSWSNYYNFEHSLSEQQVNILDKGWIELNTTAYNQKDKIEGYNVPPNNNFLNFTLNLEQQYESLVVEIVGETTCRSNGVHITEKFLHTVYGSVFPILIAPANSVEFLQELGFDMFSDVVDHEYDRIEDPEQRMLTAIESNKHLLLDRQNAIDCWHNNKHRFQRNINFCKNNLVYASKKMFCRNLLSAVN